MKNVLTILLFSFYTLSISAQDHIISTSDLVSETQLSKDAHDGFNLVWWIPVEFWKASFQSDPSVSQKEADEFVELLEDYTIFAVVYGEMGLFGSVSYVPYDSIAQSLYTVGNADQIKQFPLEEDEINNEVSGLLSIFKPLLKNMMGEMGENMHFFVFSDKHKKKGRLLDPFKEGTIKLGIFEDVIYTWNTPLGSLLKPKICPEDQKVMSGAWKFCPWHGVELIIKE